MKTINGWLVAFYDPPSRRMKAAAISYDIMSSVSFCHRGRTYHQLDRFGELETVYSTDNKIIGFSALADNLTDQHYFRSAVNALNAVVDGRRNDLNPDRDTFAEVRAGGRFEWIFWWLTETWEEFERRVDLAKDSPEITSIDAWPVNYWPVGGDPYYVYEGVWKEGKLEGDCMMILDDWHHEKYVPGFKLVTKNIPKSIPDSQSSL